MDAKYGLELNENAFETEIVTNEIRTKREKICWKGQKVTQNKLI